MTIRPFMVSIEADVLDDLRTRLARTRWPADIDDVGWTMGTDEPFMRRFCDHWANTFDWRAHELAINAHPQFTTRIGDHVIHFVHARAECGNGTPLLVMNGWPSNFYECLGLIPFLVRGSPAFDVVIPSHPGFGFSSAPTRSIGTRGIADLYAELMTRLGYEQFIADGGDVGAGVAEQLRCGHPDRLLGVYVTNLQGNHTVSAQPTPAERAYVEHARQWYDAEGAYIAVQRTKPQTLAFGLSDSPAGLAGWILEKWRGWSACEGDPDDVFSLDDLCAILTIYWATNTIGSSVRVYHAANEDVLPPVRGGPVPVGVAEFPGDIMPVVRERAEAWFNLAHYSEMPRGGHFAALEVPELMADDIGSFARVLA